MHISLQMQIASELRMGFHIFLLGFGPKLDREMVYQSKLRWELGVQSTLGWELGFGTPFTTPN